MAEPAAVPRADLIGAVEFAVVTVIWGSTWLVIKGQLGPVAPVWSVAYRFLAAAAVLAVLTVATGRWRWPTARGHAFALVVGASQFCLNYNLVYLAEEKLASGLVSLVFALLVVPNIVLAAVFLKTRVTARFVAGAVLGVAGLCLLFAPDLAAPATHADTAHGIVLVGAAVLCASVGNVLQAGRLGRSLPPLPTLTVAMAYGALLDVLYAAATAGPPTWDPRAEYGVGLAYLAVGATVVAFSLYYRLIRRIGPGPAAYSNVVVPVIALILSTLFEGYRWTSLAAAGAVVALAGLVIALGGRRAVSDTLAAPSGSRQSAG